MTQRYASLDQNGGLLGFYSGDLWPSLPAGAVAITDAQWQSWLANPNQKLVGGALVAFTPPAAPNPTTISAFAYFGRFTATETSAIHAAALVQPATAESLQLFNYLLLAAASGIVSLIDPVVTAGHAFLVAQGLLSAARSAAILTP